MRDERVPVALKIGAGVLGVLIVSPLDVFADIPVIGLLDDAVLLTLLCSLFVRLATRATVKPAGTAPPRVTALAPQA